MKTPADVVHAYFDALGRSELDAVVGLFVDDAVVMADGFETATGRAALRSVYEGVFASVRIAEEAEIDAVVERDDLAAVRTHSAGTLTRLESAASNDVAYREVFVLRRTSAGWRISDYIFNAAAG